MGWGGVGWGGVGWGGVGWGGVGWGGVGWGGVGWGGAGIFSGVSGAVIRPLSQWQMPTFFPNFNKKITIRGSLLCKSM